MATPDGRIDAYIEAAAPFAQPILRHLRQLLHQHCPELIETMKWSSPFFDYHGHPLCSMAAFKHHCAFGFWKADVVSDDLGQSGARGDFGRLTAVDDLPDQAVLAKLIGQAMQLIDAGQGSLQRGPAKAARPPLPIPAER